MDINYLQQWAGRTEEARDYLTPRLVKTFLATINASSDGVTEDAVAPRSIHWCLTPQAYTMDALGEDGHPARGGFMPPIPLPRRMWAGGRLWFSDDLRCGDQIKRCSRIEKIDIKQGRTGILAFVTVSHKIVTARGIALREEQDIVYRDHEHFAEGSQRASTESVPQFQADISEKILPSPILLFRYSAITFNSHRIHYDRNYAADVENYPGLVVHGPLQATLLLRLAERLKGASPKYFSFRSLKPLFDDAPFIIAGCRDAHGFSLRAENMHHELAMTATAQ